MPSINTQVVNILEPTTTEIMQKEEKSSHMWNMASSPLLGLGKAG